MPSGLLKCAGAGTNNCSVGREEITLDALNQAWIENRRATPPQDPSNLDALEPLLLQQLSSTPTRAWCVGERISSSYTGSLFEVTTTSGSGEVEVDIAATDIGYAANNWLDLAALKTAAGVAPGWVSKLYDQSGNAKTIAQSRVGKRPQVWSGSPKQRHTGRGACPMMLFNGSHYLELLSDSAGISAAGAFSIVVMASRKTISEGYDQPVVSFGGTDNLSNASLMLGGEDNDVVNLAMMHGDGVYKTEFTVSPNSLVANLCVCTITKAAGAISSEAGYWSGKSLTKAASSENVELFTSSTNISPTSIRIGRDVLGSDFYSLIGSVYAVLIFDTVIAPADLEIIETWAQGPFARSRDLREYPDL